ncbi:hypothetical protein [Bacillus cereus group sp. TH260-2LC]|uniref:hypothetical protein n=1 Tax=unclassified Bacillus cereus group TaxID=2750818 RepID=UPI0022E878DC|nr:hypothetical protein [Bacillus cereus group sp. TH260-2LC]MDA1527240.1 hypothetical protein [Bacillus cereus group sp. TH260-2LC]
MNSIKQKEVRFNSIDFDSVTIDQRFFLIGKKERNNFEDFPIKEDCNKQTKNNYNSIR